MGVVRALYDRFRDLIHQFIGFGVIGVTGLIITNIGYAYARDHGAGTITASTLATIIAAAVTFVGNRYISFRHRKRTAIARELLIFGVLNGVGLAIQDAVVAFNSYALGLRHDKAAEFLALNAGIAIATLFRFWSYRKFVWAAHPADEAGTGQDGPPPAGPSGFDARDSAPAGVAHANGHSPNGTNGHARPGATAQAGAQHTD